MNRPTSPADWPLSGIADPRWSPMLDLEILDAQGCYRRMNHIACRQGVPVRAVEQRYHRLRAVFRIRDKLADFGLMNPYPAGPTGGVRHG